MSYAWDVYFIQEGDDQNTVDKTQITIDKNKRHLKNTSVKGVCNTGCST